MKKATTVPEIVCMYPVEDENEAKIKINKKSVKLKMSCDCSCKCCKCWFSCCDLLATRSCQNKILTAICVTISVTIFVLILWAGPENSLVSDSDFGNTSTTAIDDSSMVTTTISP